jgi:hypothetical protein
MTPAISFRTYDIFSWTTLYSREAMYIHDVLLSVTLSVNARDNVSYNENSHLLDTVGFCRAATLLEHWNPLSLSRKVPTSPITILKSTLTF